MNVISCIVWFIFGSIVGQLLLLAIAIIYGGIKKDDKERRVSEQSDNNDNQSE